MSHESLVTSETGFLSRFIATQSKTHRNPVSRPSPLTQKPGFFQDLSPLNAKLIETQFLAPHPFPQSLSASGRSQS